MEVSVMAEQLVQSVQPDVLQSLGQLGVNVGQGASNIARNLGLGAVPDILGGATYAGERVLGGQNPFSQLTPTQAQALRTMNQGNPFMTSEQLQQTGGLKQSAQDLAGAAGWLTGGLGGVATKALPRLGIGALSGGLMGASNPQIQNMQDLATNVGAGAALGGAANVAVPAALKFAGNSISNLAFGKTGSAIPALAGETGQLIGGPGSKGAQKAVADIGQKIGNIMKKSQPIKLQDIQKLLSDVPSSSGFVQGVGTTPMDELINKLNIDDPQKAAEARQYIHPLSEFTTSRSARGERGGVNFMQHLHDSLNEYVSKSPVPEAMANYIKKAGGITNLPNIPLPASFWAKFAADLNDKVPYDEVTNAETGLKDLSKLGGRQRMQGAIAQMIKGEVKKAVGSTDPQELKDLERLNGLYGSAKAIAGGKTRGLIRPELMARYGLLLPAFLGSAAIGTSQGKTSPISPFLGAMAALSVLANPSVAGPVASQVANPVLRSAIPAVAGLVGSRGAQNLLNQQQ